MVRICVTGGRHFADRALVFATLDRLLAKYPLTIAQAGARQAPICWPSDGAMNEVCRAGGMTLIGRLGGRPAHCAIRGC